MLAGSHNIHILSQDSQIILNAYSDNLNFFHKSGKGLQALRLGDFVIYDSTTLEIKSLTEYKTCAKSPSIIDDIFKNKFLKSPTIDKQVLDLKSRTIFNQVAGYNNILSTDLNKLRFNNTALTTFFDNSRRLATQRSNLPLLQNNIVEYSIQQIRKLSK